MAHVRGHIVKGGKGGGIVEEVKQLNHSNGEISDLAGIINISSLDADKLVREGIDWFVTSPIIAEGELIDQTIVYSVNFDETAHTN